MSNKQSRLDPGFIDRQKRRLSELHNELLASRRSEEREQSNVNDELGGQAREYEDDAQKLAALELQGNLSTANDARLSSIERALQKIVDGTYGLSDKSGKPIAVERLEAYPEALHTLEEQRALDAAR